jgi:hypothetical protein
MVTPFCDGAVSNNYYTANIDITDNLCYCRYIKACEGPVNEEKWFMKKKFFASLASLTVVLGAVLLFNVFNTNSDAASLPRDCDSNSIINCGATTPEELKKFYKENKTGDLPAVYNHYGITSSMINGVTAADMGEVHKNGDITLS